MKEGSEVLSGVWAELRKQNFGAPPTTARLAWLAWLAGEGAGLQNDVDGTIARQPLQI